MVKGRSAWKVRMTLGGNGESGSGHRTSPSRSDLVGLLAVGLEAVDDDQRVVVALDGERRRRRPQHLDRAGHVDLDPDRGFGRAGEPQKGAEEQVGHRPDLPDRVRHHLRAAAPRPARRPKNEPSPSEIPLT